MSIRDNVNIEHVKQWVAALRSGKYEQGIGLLRAMTPDGARYCCLGVGCEEAGIISWDEEHDVSDDGRSARFYGAEETGDVPPAELYAWIWDGPGDQQTIAHDSLTSNLMLLNDVLGGSFSEIADYIEQELL